METTVAHDLAERFAETRFGVRGSGRVVGMAKTLDEFARIKSSTDVLTNRGRKPKWDDPLTLRAFAEGFVERGDTQGLQRRQAQNVMDKCEAAGIVVGERRAGRRTVYRLLPERDPTEHRGQVVHDIGPSASRRFWTPPSTVPLTRSLGRDDVQSVERACAARRSVRALAPRSPDQ